MNGKTIETNIDDTKGGRLIFRKTPLGEVGIISTGGNQAVYWYEKDTDKVIDKLNELLSLKKQILKGILEGL